MSRLKFSEFFIEVCGKLLRSDDPVVSDLDYVVFDPP